MASPPSPRPLIRQRATWLLIFLPLLFASYALLRSPPGNVVPEADGADQDGLLALLLFEEMLRVGQGLSQVQARLVDPASLADVPGHAPIELGCHPVGAASASRGLLAAVVRPPDCGAGELHVFDLSTGSDVPTGLLFFAWDVPMAFNREGTALFWTEQPLANPYQVVRYDLAGKIKQVITSLPAGFLPQELQVLSSGQLAFYGLVQERRPLLVLVDAESGATTQVALEGVRAGLVENSQETTPDRLYAPGLVWDLTRERLYLLHADEDVITVVDLAAGQVLRQAAIRPASPGLFSWLVSPAEAKESLVTERRGVLSPDGQRLYILAMEDEYIDLEPGWVIRPKLLGLQVVATETLQQVAHLDLPASELAVSPDGRWLLLASGQGASGTTEDLSPWTESSGLTVLDAHTLEQRFHQGAGEWFTILGFTSDGQGTYISQPGGVVDGEFRGILRRLDLNSLAFVAEREGNPLWWRHPQPIFVHLALNHPD